MPRAAVAGPAMRSQNVAPQNRPGGMPAAGNSSTPQPEAAAAGERLPGFLQLIHAEAVSFSFDLTQ